MRLIETYRDLAETRSRKVLPGLDKPQLVSPRLSLKKNWSRPSLKTSASIKVSSRKSGETKSWSRCRPYSGLVKIIGITRIIIFYCITEIIAAVKLQGLPGTE